MILLDPDMLVPHDLLNSFNYAMVKYIEKYPAQAEHRWHVINGAYVPQIEYKKDTGLVPVMDHIVKWVDQYPQKLKIRDGALGSERKILELDRQFLSQFAVVRRSFNLRSKVGSFVDFNSVIDLDLHLSELGCTLQDILNVYKIYHY